MFIYFPWKFPIRHSFPESPSLGDLCTKSHLIDGRVCFALTWICQGKKFSFLAGEKSWQLLFSIRLRFSAWKEIYDIFSCPVNRCSGLFILCTTWVIFLHQVPYEEPSAPSSSVSPAWSLTGILAGSGMIVQAAFFSPHLQSRHRTAVHLPLKLQRKETQNYSESSDDAKCWGLMVVCFFFLITRKWPNFIMPESHLWNFNMCYLLWE